jgi:hypothetical protein
MGLIISVRSQGGKNQDARNKYVFLPKKRTKM